MGNHPIKTFECEDCGSEFQATQARWCERCRCPHQGNWGAKKYIWTPEKDQYLRERYDGAPGRPLEIAKGWGWPKWVITHRAQKLGLAHNTNRREWTEKEEKFLNHWAGYHSVEWIAEKLNRGVTSIVMKFKHMEISRRVRAGGYTLRELELCFGVDHHQIDRWIREGKLRDRRRQTNRTEAQGQPHNFNEAAVLDFIRENRMSFRLDKVDQVWFMDLIFQRTGRRSRDRSKTKTVKARAAALRRTF